MFTSGNEQFYHNLRNFIAQLVAYTLKEWSNLYSSAMEKTIFTKGETVPLTSPDITMGSFSWSQGNQMKPQTSAYWNGNLFMYTDTHLFRPLTCELNPASEVKMSWSPPNAHEIDWDSNVSTKFYVMDEGKNTPKQHFDKNERLRFDFEGFLSFRFGNV